MKRIGSCMFSIFNKNSKEGQLKKNLLDFLGEMEKNLELFYVMDQRQFITSGYLTDIWPLVKDLDMIKNHETIVKYAQATESFNLSLKAYKEYENWYTGDSNNKTPENSRKLHALKHDLDEKLKGMEAVIIPAGQDLEREMLKLGLLKA
jgi:hypothetical protein